MTQRRTRRLAPGEATPTRRRKASSEPPPIGSRTLALLVAGQDHFATYAIPRTGPVSIGRAENNVICIEDPTLSRHHARLHVPVAPDGQLTIEDLGSANGTRVRTRKIAANQRIPIHINEAFMLGSVTLILQQRRVGGQRMLLRSNDYFEERLYDECARAERYQTGFTIAHLRLERQLPTEQLQLCFSRLRPSDVVAVYGPGEYDLLLVELDANNAQVVVDRVVASLKSLGVGCRVGIATYGIDGTMPGDLAAATRARTRAAVQIEKFQERYVVRDPAMAKIHDLAKRIAATDIVVLLLGETGVGKEVLAEVIHHSSPRSRGPFVKLNCAALTQSLLESELFGHERGAFTGADKTKPGLLEVGVGGTVFLDEVGEMPLDTQSKLLRVLEERKLMRVGGTKPLDVDVRFIAATNRDLESAVELRRFRADLFYRLNAFSIMLPPLRERPREIELLARLFIDRICAQLSRPAPQLAPDALAILLSYHWPGNIRELRNVIERATILTRGDRLQVEHLPDKLRAMSSATPPARSAPARSPGAAPPLVALKRRVSREEERALIIDALQRSGGNQTDAAALLGVSRRTLMSRLDHFQIPRPRKKSRR